MKLRKIIATFFTALTLSSFLVTGGCEDKKDDTKNPDGDKTASDSLTGDAKEDYSNKAKVILLVGQSNMAGATFNPTARAVGKEKMKEYKTGYENVKIMFSSGIRGTAENTWNTSGGVFKNTGLSQGATMSQFGPELGLAEYLNEQYPGEEFYLVKHALGGAQIDDYLGRANPDLDCYSHIKKQFDLAVNEIKKTTDKEIVVVAICWMQGESESAQEAAANTYKERTEKLIKNFRTDYKDYAPAGGISWIDAGISDSSLWPLHKTINNAKKEISDANDKNYFIDTIGAGLVVGADNAHYDPVSVIKLGRLFGEKVQEVITKG
jgi:hypothetical protein